MKRHRLIPILVFLPLLLFATTGCQKEENKVIGTWSYSLIGNGYTETHSLSFTADVCFSYSKIYTSESGSNSIVIRTITGNYIFDEKNSRIIFLPKDSPSTLSCIISFVDNLMILSEYSDEGEEGILVFKKN